MYVCTSEPNEGKYIDWKQIFDPDFCVIIVGPCVVVLTKFKTPSLIYCKFSVHSRDIGDHGYYYICKLYSQYYYLNLF